MVYRVLPSRVGWENFEIPMRVVNKVQNARHSFIIQYFKWIELKLTNNDEMMHGNKVAFVVVVEHLQ